MSLVIDANMKLFAERLNITSSRMVQDYGLASIDDIIKSEAEKGNTKAVLHAREYCSSPEKLIEVFKLADVENKFAIINSMDEKSRLGLLPYLSNEDLVMGLYFFTQEKLLALMMEVDIVELVRVILEAFPFEKIIEMFSEEDLANFFMQKDLKKEDVVEQLKLLPPDVMQKFVEGITGRPAEETNPEDLINSISQLPDDKFGKFMAGIDPDVQRQLVFQLTKEEPKYLTLFPNETYVNMLSTLMKQDMVAPMVMLNKETLMEIDAILPAELLSIVATQIDTRDFAKYLQDGHMDLLQSAMMI